MVLFQRLTDDLLNDDRFNEVRDAVTEVITAEVGMDADTLLREAEKAA